MVYDELIVGTNTSYDFKLGGDFNAHFSEYIQNYSDLFIFFSI